MKIVLKTKKPSEVKVDGNFLVNLLTVEENKLMHQVFTPGYIKSKVVTEDWLHNAVDKMLSNHIIIPDNIRGKVIGIITKLYNRAVNQRKANENSTENKKA